MASLCRKRVVLFTVILFVVLLIGHISCSGKTNMPVNTGFEEGMEGMSAYKGDISITEKRENVRSGKRALEWRYKIKKKGYNFIARNGLDSSQFEGAKGLTVWLKSDKEGPMLFKVIEKGNASYQYINHGIPVKEQWGKFTLPFGAFEKDPDVADKNNRLDIGQIKEIWIVDISGYYFQDLVGPRTVWVDDLRLDTISPSSPLPKGVAAADAGKRLQVLPTGPVGAAYNLKSDPHVMKDGSVYKMWFGANRSGKYQQVWYATSSDGMDWDMYAKPVIVVGAKGGWDAGDIETPTVAKVGDVYHLWYCGRAVSEEAETWSTDTAYKIGHATSIDGIKWVKDPKNPVIGLGNKARNEWNWAGASEPSVIYEDGVFKMWFVGVNVLGGKCHLHVGYATSTDGSNWREYPKNPVIASKPTAKSIDYNGYFCPFVAKEGNRYIMFYVSDSWNSLPVGPIRYATSVDGIDWTIGSAEILSKGDVSSWTSTGIFAPSAIIENGRLSIWYTGFRITTNFYFGIGHTRLDKSVLK